MEQCIESRARVSKVLNRKRALTMEMIRNLHIHDLFKRYRAESHEKRGAHNFMSHVVERFEKGYHNLDKGAAAAKGKLLFIWDKEHLQDAKEPLDAIKRYLAEKQEKRA
jgi:antitoxin component HigA of HigAB toxin-antitoxin module